MLLGVNRVGSTYDMSVQELHVPAELQPGTGTAEPPVHCKLHMSQDSVGYTTVKGGTPATGVMDPRVAGHEIQLTELGRLAVLIRLSREK